MPELPEVETVRRGLAPVMEGARFRKVEARRGDLRWPLPKDFAQRLEGNRVEGLGRRAKYLLADLASGDVLLMHLGMSGSFRVLHRSRAGTPGRFHHERSKLLAHDHVVFHMDNGSIVTFNDPRRFGSMKIMARAQLERYCELIAALKLRTSSMKGRHLSTAEAIRLVETYGVETPEGHIQAPTSLLTKTTVNRPPLAYARAAAVFNAAVEAFEKSTPHTIDCRDIAGIVIPHSIDHRL